MITNKLYKTILVDPIHGGGSELFIVSGFASPSFANYYLSHWHERINLHLLVGMTGKEGLGRRSHDGFQYLSLKFRDKFDCSYLSPPRCAHVKSYAWFSQDGIPIVGFTGSANYTNQAFRGYQEEAVVEDNPVDILDYYNQLVSSSINCLDPQVEKYIHLFDEIQLKHQSLGKANPESIDLTTVVEHPASELSSITISLLDKNGKLPELSGLNWGQRPGREPNQAYIRIPADVYRTDFFPDRGTRFVIHTDDGNQLNCATAQETLHGRHGKAIHSYENNSILGFYFRHRLGLSPGEQVTLKALQNYGRTAVVFYKIDEETFYMDFSKP